MITITAYKPLARLGRVYYLPTTKGFIFYDRRTKTAMYSPAFAAKVYRKYAEAVKPSGEWELPKEKITIKNWACGIINKSAVATQYERKVFILMGYHYVQLGRPKKFWEGLLNADKRFKYYVLPSFKIDPKGPLFLEKAPFSYKETLKLLERMQNRYLTENLIYGPQKTEIGDDP